MKPMRPLKLMAKATVGAILILLMGSLLLPLSAGATPASTGASPSWAYGGSRVVNGSGTFTTPNGVQGTYTFHEYYGWAVVFNQTNTSASTFEIQGNRATGTDLFLNFCVPNCTAPRHEVNLTAAGWEKDTAYANFTENGTVFVNGTNATPAVALENEQWSTAANETGARVSTTDPSTNGYETVALQSSGAVSFQPSLGLFPDNPVPGEFWNASANYTGQASWTWAYDVHTPSTGSRAGTLSGNVSRTGSVTLRGMDLGNTTLRGGVVVRQVGYSVIRGPFRFADGWFMLPLQADLFAGNSPSWQGAMGANGAQFGTGAVDFSQGSGHYGMMAASSSFTPQATSPSLGGDVAAFGSGASSLSAAATGFPSSSIQGEPMSVSDARNLISSVTSVTLPSYTAPISSKSPGDHPVVLAVIVGAVVVGLVAVAYIGMDRSRPKRPAGPLATRYREAAAEAGDKVSPRSSSAETATEGVKDPHGDLT